MKNFFLFIILLVAAVSILLLVRFNKENTDVTRILEQERYSRMTAEEELQRGEYRVKKLEADLQATQVKLSRHQEALDKARDQNEALKSDLDEAKKGASQGNALRKDLDEVQAAKAVLEQKLRDAETELRDAAGDLKKANARADAFERKAEQLSAAAAAMAQEDKK